jgi:hypothetical protein
MPKFQIHDWVLWVPRRKEGEVIEVDKTGWLSGVSTTYYKVQDGVDSKVRSIPRRSSKLIRRPR